MGGGVVWGGGVREGGYRGSWEYICEQYLNVYLSYTAHFALNTF